VVRAALCMLSPPGLSSSALFPRFMTRSIRAFNKMGALCSSDIRTCIPFREGRNSALLRTASIDKKKRQIMSSASCKTQRPLGLVGHKGNWVNLDLGRGLAACLCC
jgi:hypothetical protein